MYDVTITVVVWLGFVKLQVRQDDQQVAVAAQQVLLGQNQALQKRRPRHGQSVAGGYTVVRSFALRCGALTKLCNVSVYMYVLPGVDHDRLVPVSPRDRAHHAHPAPLRQSQAH